MVWRNTFLLALRHVFIYIHLANLEFLIDARGIHAIGNFNAQRQIDAVIIGCRIGPEGNKFLVKVIISLVSQKVHQTGTLVIEQRGIERHTTVEF